MKKNILGISTLVVLVAAISVGYYFNFSGDVANANPDYICVKPSTNNSCIITNVGAWQNDGTRTSTGFKALEVGYYHTRTSCETGYSAKVSGTTGGSNSASTKAPTSNLDSEGKLATSSHPSSGRHSSDFTYSSETCTITEVDDLKPVGTFK